MSDNETSKIEPQTELVAVGLPAKEEPKIEKPKAVGLAAKEVPNNEKPKDNYSVPLSRSCVVEFGWCCYGMTLPCCALYSMRTKLLGDKFYVEYDCCQDNGCEQCKSQ